MPNVAFLSTDNLEEFFVYDELLIPHFEQQGWQVETISWRTPACSWDDFDYIIVRSTWDYQQYPEAFMRTLEQIEASDTCLLNPLSLIKWNIEKYYLRDLANQGINIVPTQWQAKFDEAVFTAQYDKFATDTLIIKPVLSANADDTFKVERDAIFDYLPQLSRCFAQREHMIQPFIPSVIEEGEYSLFYFGGKYSHGILKVPETGDFRVQEEHGGKLYTIDPTIDMLQSAQHAVSMMPTQALYARVDLIRIENHWAIMELELIEPSLYFNLDPASAPRFVDAMLSFHQQQR
ncbi:hypothetical protein GTH32_04255 [Alteromonas sp. 345S023]|uniref:Prokaryotic glutathione synthetase ATP-binding domain-containing protein n=1 Tax=Alteromonas profundi TaxID=2696062 RepID=A0A7X5RJX9_9ALTE|nr:hypothetical protein [Alteromonas profundi]